jgi:AcrR family transcriptional regulator
MIMPINMKENICDALVRLLDTKDTSRITVTDLVQACAISRPSFYYHFRDLDEVIRYAIHRDLHSRFRPEDGRDALVHALSQMAYSDLLTRLLARRDESVREALLDGVCDLLSELTMIPLSGFRVPISDTAAMIEFIGCGIVGMMIQSRRWEISSPALLDERLRSVLAHIRTA